MCTLLVNIQIFMVSCYDVCLKCSLITSIFITYFRFSLIIYITMQSIWMVSLGVNFVYNDHA